MTCLLISAVSGAAGRTQTPPWRMQQALNMPTWLSVSGAHRTRYETLDHQFRARVNGRPGNGGDQALVFRTLLHARIDLKRLRFGAELMDSRITLVDQGTASSSSRLTTTIANPLELLQAYLEVPLDNWLVNGSQSVLRGGRITMDIGSRRLVARNHFRNTINGFTGLDWQWQHENRTVRAFYTLPVQRLVDGNIRNNESRFDEEHKNVRFWGLYYSQPLPGTNNQGEVYWFGLDEQDARDLKTKDRELYTVGMRFWRRPQTSRFDYQLESVYQLGESRTSTTATQKLDHRAHFQHAELGYSFDATWVPRLVIQYDFASGDDRPDDGDNKRFDTLFGARRFDFGPTSIYGAFARSNLNSPSIRLILKPRTTFQTLLSLRGFWRASTRDAWTGAGLRGNDPYIGTQIEARVRWDILPGNLRLEAGAAHLFNGTLMNEAGKNNSTYAYTQAILKF